MYIHRDIVYFYKYFLYIYSDLVNMPIAFSPTERYNMLTQKNKNKQF